VGKQAEGWPLAEDTGGQNGGGGAIYRNEESLFEMRTNRLDKEARWGSGPSPGYGLVPLPSPPALQLHAPCGPLTGGRWERS